ncbi:MAG: winged helix DNA-binding domain-containing protein [Rhodobacteraceae bacterium]|nr:winged helix DNA-binding domain-containing protein [Paracoccaceae bacterium]
MTALKISNRNARRLWLDSTGLASTPTGKLDLAQMIHDLGFVQLDTIQVVSRAQHHILWSRNQNYREGMLDQLLVERGVFEHYTHDASVIPTAFYPYWRRQFRRAKQSVGQFSYLKGLSDSKYHAAIKQRIANEGPLSTKAFDSKIVDRSHLWARPPHKVALDYQWYTGELATSHRVNFTKFYDLAENVIPADLRNQEIDDTAQIDWLCHGALNRLGIASLGEVQKFWEAASAKEVRDWAARTDLRPVQVQGADGSWTDAFATPDIEERLATSPTSRLRILNPFDPAVRDRNRLNRLFGFDYRIEIFVPKTKRHFGYYVYPLLEGSRFVGRIEVKADRAKGALTVLNLWIEPDVKWSPQRAFKLEAELGRMARFVGGLKVIWQAGNPTQ